MSFVKRHWLVAAAEAKKIQEKQNYSQLKQQRQIYVSGDQPLDVEREMPKNRKDKIPRKYAQFPSIT